MSGLVVRDLQVSLDKHPIIRDVSFSAPAGAVTGFIGPNGAGKSTLLAAILGLRRPSGGTITFDGIDLPAMAAAERAKLCAYVEQFATTTERLTVRDVVALGRVPFQSTWQASPSARDQAIVAAALETMGVAEFAGRLYLTLSGGQQQRVQIARALAQEPRLLLLDEPTSHLDIQAQLRVLALLRRRASVGCTVLLAMHDLNLALRYCDHVVVLQSGRVVAEGAPGLVLDADLLRRVYGVEASIVRLTGSSHPIVVYDQAVEDNSVQKAD